MLPYEIERHAKAIFARLIVWAPPTSQGTEHTADTLVQEAVRIARDFAVLVDELAEPRPVSLTLIKEVTFEELVRLWQRYGLKSWLKADPARIFSRFQQYLFPTLGSRLATEISSPEIVAALRKVEDAGHLPLAHLILRELNRLYRFAIAAGYARDNPARELWTALYRWRPRRRPTILAPTQIGELLRAINSYHGHSCAKYLLRLMPFVIVRSSELREAEWKEINFRMKEWRIPARRMKGGRPHIVPLSRQAMDLFRELHRLTGYSQYVFASSRTPNGIISDGVFTKMLRTLGFRGRMTATGFRSMAATHLSELGWSADAIERQLSHLDPGVIGRTYNFAEYLPERRRMMQAWANYLDKLASQKPGALKAGAAQVNIARPRSLHDRLQVPMISRGGTERPHRRLGPS